MALPCFMVAPTPPSPHRSLVVIGTVPTTRSITGAIPRVGARRRDLPCVPISQLLPMYVDSRLPGVLTNLPGGRAYHDDGSF